MQGNSENTHRLLQLFEQLRHYRRGSINERLSVLNLSLTHLRVLQLLASHRQLAMKEIAEQMRMTPPSVTALIRRLVASGLVQRHAHANDNRIVLLSLTDAGHTLLQAIYQDQLQQMDQLLQGLADEEQILLLNVLERAVQTMYRIPDAESHCDSM